MLVSSIIHAQSVLFFDICIVNVPSILNIVSSILIDNIVMISTCVVAIV